MSFHRFTWRGEPIYDIVAWTKKRGEQMVYYRLITKTVYGDAEEYGRMPESFWNSLMFKGNERYTELYRK